MTEAEVGKTITVIASYTDDHGTLETVANTQSATVANLNDAPTGSVNITGTATQGQTLTVTNTLADVDGLGAITYTWQANGSALPGATGNTYFLTAAEVGKTITVLASYTDGYGVTETLASAATAVIANSTPVGTLGQNIGTTVFTTVPFTFPLSFSNNMASSVSYSVNLVDAIAPNSATFFADNTASLNHKFVNATKDVVIINATPDQQSQAASTSSEQQTVIAQSRENSMAANFKDVQTSAKPDYPIDMEHVFTEGEQQALWQRLDSLRQQIDQSELHHHALEVNIIVGSTLSLTAGFVSWALRGGTLLASLLSNVPLLKRFDPLPIFIAAKKSATPVKSENQQHSDEEIEDKLEQLFSLAVRDEDE